MFHSEQLILSAASSLSHFVLLGLLCPAAICPESEKKKKDLFVKFADQNSLNYVILCYFSQKLACPSKKQAYQQSSHQLLFTLKTKVQ